MDITENHRISLYFSRIQQYKILHTCSQPSAENQYQYQHLQMTQ